MAVVNLCQDTVKGLFLFGHYLLLEKLLYLYVKTEVETVVDSVCL